MLTMLTMLNMLVATCLWCWQCWKQCSPDADPVDDDNKASMMLIILTMLTRLFVGCPSHLKVSTAACPCSSLGSCHLRWELSWPGSTLTPCENVVRMLCVAESCWLKWVVMEILMIWAKYEYWMMIHTQRSWFRNFYYAIATMMSIVLYDDDSGQRAVGWGGRSCGDHLPGSRKASAWGDRDCDVGGDLYDEGKDGDVTDDVQNFCVETTCQAQGRPQPEVTLIMMIVIMMMMRRMRMMMVMSSM